jgi:hypothetical protein
MATLQDFTSADEIRSVLGVSPEELEDSTIGLALYYRQLQFDLTEISSSLESAYLTVLALPESGRTVIQQKFFDVTAVYSAYFVSRLLLTSLNAFAPKQITDGKATVVRTDDPFKLVREGVNAQYAVMRTRLLAAYAATGGGVGNKLTRVYTTSAGLSTDPVTNV